MKIDLGCGFRKPENYIGIDNREICRPDLVCDIENGLPFNDNSISEIRAFDYLEHVHQNKVFFVMNEIWRVLIPQGKLELLIPSTDGRGAFQDFTHRSYWNINSLWYWTIDEYRDLYQTKAKFQGLVKNVWTDTENKIIHVYANLVAVK
jgi:predicted SAM-dependent methyltransferase